MKSTLSNQRSRLRRFLVAFTVTAGGAGFVPVAPGTAGTVIAALLYPVIQSATIASQITLFILLFFAGWWASTEWSKMLNSTDAQTIVIDEVLGYFLALILFRATIHVTPTSVHLTDLHLMLIAFVAFRIFDTTKPFPIRRLDKWGKKLAVGPLQSLMVIVDDLLAGLFTWITLLLANQIFSQ